MLSVLGRLTNDEYPVGLAGRTVKVMWYHDGTYTRMVDTITDGAGYYGIPVTVSFQVPNTPGVYTYFVNWDGDTEYFGAYTPYTDFTVVTVPLEPSLYLYVTPASGKSGDRFTFYGSFEVDGNPLPGRAVLLYRNTVHEGSGVTDEFGDYQISWVADLEGDPVFHTEAQYDLQIIRNRASVLRSNR